VTWVTRGSPVGHTVTLPVDTIPLMGKGMGELRFYCGVVKSVATTWLTTQLAQLDSKVDLSALLS